MHALTIRPAVTAQDMLDAGALFREYQQHIGIDLTFQGFEEELAHLPGKYGLPQGELLLAYWHNALAGCAALRPLDAGICEMKRLYVRSAYAGKGIGAALLERVISGAKEKGYERLRLDSLHSMKSAAQLYQRYDFYSIPPYNASERADIYYLERML